MRKLSFVICFVFASVLLFSAFAFADDTPLKPNGPWITEMQEVKLSSLHDYNELVKTLENIEKNSPNSFELSTIGTSNEGRDIYLAKVGTGDTKVMFITQQHGNEPLGTEAALEVLKYLSTDNAKVQDMLEQVTVYIVPRVNVDGAEIPQRANVDTSAPTRNTDEGIYSYEGVGYDINRWHWLDWENSLPYTAGGLTSNPVPEAVAVIDAFKAIDPDWIVDLHHQGTYVSEDGEMIKTSIKWPTNENAPDNAVDLSKQMCRVIYDHLNQFGYTEVSQYPGGDYPGIARNAYGLAGKGSVLVEMRGVGQKSSGYLTKTFMETMMALINSTANGSLYDVDPTLANQIPERDWDSWYYKDLPPEE